MDLLAFACALLLARPAGAEPYPARPIDGRQPGQHRHQPRLLDQGTEPAFLAPAAFRAFITAEQRRWAEVVRVSGVKIQ